MDHGSIREPDMMPLFVSWHTDDPFYLMQSKRLEESLDLFGLERRIEVHPRPGDWRRCCFHKPYFILGMLDRFKGRDIVYIDADGEIKAQPELLGRIKTDLAFVENGNGCALASMIYFSNNWRTREFICDWIRENENFQDERAADQENFSYLVHALESAGRISATRLPPSYNFEDGITKPIDCPVVIYQWIASRISRMPEFEKAIAI